MIIKIHGERNTGTHYLMQLMLGHLDIMEKKGSAVKIAPDNPPVDLQRLGELGWKHRLVSPEFLQNLGVGPDAIFIVALVKNPYSWLLSLHKRPYAPIHLRTGLRVKGANGRARRRPFLDRLLLRIMPRFGRRINLFLNRYARWCSYEKLAFSDFIRAKWFSEFQEGRDEGFKNPIELWNEKNKAYLELAKHYKVLLLTYEEFLAAPEPVLKKIADRVGLQYQAFNNLHEAAKEEDKASKSHQHYRDYYLNERWREKLLPQDIEWISSQLDPAVMAAFGYQYL